MRKYAPAFIAGSIILAYALTVVALTYLTNERYGDGVATGVAFSLIAAAVTTGMGALVIDEK